METESLALDAEQYRIEKRLPSWKTDDVIAESSASTLGNSINEHFGRWLYELFQNAEDAGATQCRVRLVGCDLLITDNGKGIPKSPPSELRRAVKSLSNPFVSTKQGSDNIGRKGIGFCSVYQLTNSPMVWSGGSGIGFSPERTEALLSADSSLSCLKENSRDLPFLHALLPFGVSQAPLVFKAIPDEELIKGTTVWLPLNQSLTTADIIKSFEDLDHQFLLTFKWLEAISLEIDGNRVVSIKKSAKQFRSSPENTKSFRLIKGSSEHSVIRQRYVIWNSTEHPPKELLEATVPCEKDRQRLERCDVSVIAGVNASGILERIKQAPKLFVYYPTEETLPFGVIAHGDFILDGSRKHLVDHSQGTLNFWLLDRLAALLIRTANSLIADDRHTEAFDLLKLPSAQLVNEVDALLPTFRARVLKELLLPKADDYQEIEAFAPIEEFIFPDPNLLDRSLALPLLQNAFPDKLVAHSKFCVTELKSFVESYSGKWVNQETLRKRLEFEPKFQESSQRIEWCKAAWLWLAVTFEGSPALTSTHLENLKIVPSSSGLHALKDERGLPCLVLNELSVSELPKWIKIDALPMEFSLWLQKADSKIGRIVNALGIQIFSETSVVQAFIRAIQDESKSPVDSGSLRYIDFAKDRKWPEHPELDDFAWDSVCLGNIPVPVLSNDTAEMDQPWAKACDSYFGAGWGNDDLQQVIGHEPGIRWVDPSIEKDWPHAREFLLLCGVFEVPKLTEYSVSSIQKDDYWNRVKNEFPEDQPKKHLEIPEIKCRDPKPKIEKLGGVRIPTIDLYQAAALLRLIKMGWTSNFQSSAKPLARFEKRGKPTDFFATNVWFQELLENLQVASSRGGLIESGPLGELWVKGYETPDWAWHLFPRLNVDQISDEDPDFEKWILDSGFVRTRSSDIPLSDWSSKILPELKKQITEASDQEPRKLIQIAAVATNVYRGLFSVFKTEKPPDLSSARVCWDHKKLRLGGNAETTWAVFSEPELEFWRDHLPVYLFRRSDTESPAFNALGYKRLDKALAISLEDPLDVESDGPRTDELQDFAAWLFADRRNQIDISPPIVSWQKVKVHTQNEIRVKSTIEGKSFCDTRPHFFDEAGSRLVMSIRAWNDVRLRATAFVDAFKLPSAYRDRIEILLRLGIEERRDRMIEEGIHESDLQTWLKEYRGEQMIHERERRPNPPQSPTTVAPPTGTPMREGNSNPKEADEDTPDPVPLHGAEVQPVFPDGFPSKPNPLSNDAQHRESSSPRNYSRRKPPHDALDVEKRSREIVKRELERLGYEVEEMAQQNKGFDLKAKKDTEVVIIEVKGNKDSTSEVFLTPAEHEFASQYRWQLWHVSRLAQDSGAQPEIRIYGSIPPEALTPDSFILDLSACTPILQADL